MPGAGVRPRSADASGGVAVEAWGSERLDEIVALAGAALPDESLSADELLSALFEDPDRHLVVGTADGSGVAAGVLRTWGSPPHELRLGHLVLIAVHPAARRAGRGGALLAAVEGWAYGLGASQVQLGGSAPFYLWPGVDAWSVGATCLAEAAGYECTGAAFDMAVPASFRAPVPPGVDVRRVLDDDDVADLRRLVDDQWPHWWPETARGVDQATCHAAFDGGGRAVGFVCHSVNRTGHLGPMGTDPAVRGTGVGHALVSAVCEDLMVAGRSTVEIDWVGPARFYAKAGAVVSRCYRTFTKPRAAAGRP